MEFINSDNEYVEAVAFHEVAKDIVGCSATKFSKLVETHPNLRFVLGSILEGSRVDVLLKDGNRHTDSNPKYKKDPKIVQFQFVEHTVEASTVRRPLYEEAMELSTN